MQYINLDSFNDSIQLEKYPFVHIVIDNFLKEEYINDFLYDLDRLKPEHAYYNGYPSVENKKQAFRNNLGDFTNALFKELSSEQFIQKIERLTGIENIIKNNTDLNGAGIHKVYNGGHLTMHKDFKNTHHNGVLIDRQINLLLYMNPEWKEEYNGHLCLYDEKKGEIVKKILPILNRCVIFNTIDSIHGHPHPLNLPNDDICRQSLALYYYTVNTNGVDRDTPNNTFEAKWYFDIR